MNLIILFRSDFIDGPPSSVRFSGRRLEHLLSICRVAVGDSLRVGLLNGNMGQGVIERIESGFIDLTVTLDTPPPPPLACTLIMALPRPKVLKRCLEYAASAGIKKIFIIGSWKVEKSYWTNPVLTPGGIEKHLILGLEQGCDTALPDVELRKRFRPFAEDELPAIVKNTRAFVGHPYAAQVSPREIAGPVTLAIGPEGGFIPYEIESLKKAGFEDISLGQRILRVEHAIPHLIGRIL